jgi:hypothetical protein
MEPTLWASATGQRYFLIPADVTPPHGDYALRSVLDGRELWASEAALAGFEVDEAAARRIVEQALGPLAAQALGLPDVTLAPPSGGAPRGQALEELLADLLGCTPAALAANPALLDRGAAGLLGQIAGALESAGQPSAGQRAFARAQIRKLRKQLRAQGVATSPRLKQIAEQVPRRQGDLAALLRRFAALLERPDSAGEERLRALFDAVERDFGDLFDDPEERDRREEQRRREYRRSADAAIARSLLAHGITPVDSAPGESGV